MLNTFADTSLLCALYREQENSAEADRLLLRESTAPIQISSLVVFEFRQSVRLQRFRFSADRTQGYPAREGERMLQALQANITQGSLHVAAVDWPAVHALAEDLSARHTAAGGYRTFDVLHVATAVHVKAGRFLTFDARQAALARAAGLVVKPAGGVRR